MPQLPSLVQALLKPDIYPESTNNVTLKQTQMSFVFLTDDFVYKVKKAVNLGYLDYSTLEARHYYCRRELELNRRFCPDVYLSVVPITRHNGQISFGGGEVIEYDVKMRRLPQNRMMDSLLTEDEVTLEMIAELAARLARFHTDTETNDNISTFGKLETIRGNIEENFSQTEKYIGQAICPEQFKHIKYFSKDFIEQNEALFEKRVKEGCIRDLHGDLHAAHICFTNGICIYDCIEFNDRFRYGDVASEVAFLAMDLDHYGRADLSRHFVNSYTVKSGDNNLSQLMRFYKSYRAYVRGKVTCFKLDDPCIGDKEKKNALEEASRYFYLSQSYVKQKPNLIITAGLVGCGKSSFSRSLAGRLGLVVISSDITRKRLAGIPVTEHRFNDFEGDIYSQEFSLKTYEAMFREAEQILDQGYSVILDASFIKSDMRLKAQKLARESGADFLAIECHLDETSTRERLAKRLKEVSASDGHWELYARQKNEFEPLVDVPTPNYVIIDSSEPIAGNITKIIDKVSQL